ncbi:cation-translocating P-type ATPase [Roseibium sp. RKSG952]|nr:cation-translocating P-type ATPase [Roseibium sp. RKSG952]
MAILQKVLGPKVGGNAHLAFDTINARMTILGSAKPIATDQVIKLVAATGMSAKPWDDKTADADHQAHLTRQRRFTIASGAFWLAGIALHMFEAGPGRFLDLFHAHGGTAIPIAEMGLFMLAILFGGWLVAPKAWSSFRRLSPDMNLLMIVAVAGAVGLGDYFEASTVAFLFALSLVLETYSVGRARNAVAALLDLAPPRARVVRPDGSEADIPAAEVKAGDHFIIRAGDRIPLDGTVTEGRTSINQAPITGESALVDKEEGDGVYAGTINADGTITVRATRIASDTVLARIIRMVNDAQSRRANIEQWVTRFARAYTPAVMALAVLIVVLPPLIAGGDWSSWFYNALVLLVIACPCALVISTPVSIVAALASSARAGVLVKGGAFMEAPGRLEAIALDKTGTLTEGRPEVSGLYPVTSKTPEDLIAAVSALETRSSHPLAQAILHKAETSGVKVTAAQDIVTIPGRGLQGRWNHQEIWLGSLRLAQEKGVSDQIPDAVQTAISEGASTWVVAGIDQHILGLVELRDRIRPNARQIVQRLHEQGVRKIVMLTGDNTAAAHAVAEEVGVDEVHAELLPQDKASAIRELSGKYKMVAMIGDGVNDAPAMAEAGFGIAMGAIGSDVAIETADIALMNDDIGKVPWLIGHSRRTMAIIRQNIGISLVTKSAFVIATAFGMASMWGAIAADVGVSLLVVANALRLLKAPDTGWFQDRSKVARSAPSRGRPFEA